MAPRRSRRVAGEPVEGSDVSPASDTPEAAAPGPGSSAFASGEGHDAPGGARGAGFIASLKAQSAAFHERRRPRGIYRLLAPLHRKYDQYEMTTGLYMLDLWEKLLVNALLALLLGLMAYGAAQQGSVLAGTALSAASRALERGREALVGVEGEL